ncbi:MAG: hypothetical protein EAZ26_02805 [Runella slithyformis]|nr:MAG: hypothetical protein EAZ26_02805 [Runella slithyformis]
MKNTLLIVGFALLAFLANAQVTQRNMLGNKYALEAVKQTLLARDQFKPYPTTPQEWKAAVPDSVLLATVKLAETLIDFKFEPISASVSLDFMRSGDRTRHGNISFAKRNTLINLVLAESMENQGRFTEAILNGVWSICEESFWGVPAHISGTGLPDAEDRIVDLFAAETAAVLALTDYFTGEKLDKINKLVRKRIYYETNLRIFEPMLRNPDRYGWMSKTKPVNNWNPWIMSNWMTATLFLEKDEARRAQMLHQSMLGLDLYLNGLGDDGGCDEGPSYWFAAGACVFDCLELLEAATQQKVNIYNEPFIQKMASYVYKTHISDDYFVNFADADPKLKPDGVMLYRFGKKLNDPALVTFGQWAYSKFSAAVSNNGFHRMRRVQNLLTIKNIVPNAAAYQPVSDAWLNDIQVLTARSNSGLFMATHGGHNAESHNHNDVGDFLLYSNGEPVLIDAGRGNYTARTFSSRRYELWFTQSEYHNLPIINGVGQKAGRPFEAKNVTSTVNDKEATLAMDIASAYPKEAGVQSWSRSVKLNRVKNQVEMVDTYTLTEAKSLHQVFMTISAVDISTAGKIILKTPKNQTAEIEFDPKLWEASVEIPSTDGMEYSSFKTKWDAQPASRILLTHKKVALKGKVAFTVKMK